MKPVSKIFDTFNENKNSICELLSTFFEQVSAAATLIALLPTEYSVRTIFALIVGIVALVASMYFLVRSRGK